MGLSLDFLQEINIETERSLERGWPNFPEGVNKVFALDEIELAQDIIKKT